MQATEDAPRRQATDEESHKLHWLWHKHAGNDLRQRNGPVLLPPPSSFDRNTPETAATPNH